MKLLALAVMLLAFGPSVDAGGEAEFDRTVAAFKKLFKDRGLTGGREEGDAWNDPPLRWNYSVYRPAQGFSAGMQVSRSSPGSGLETAIREAGGIRSIKDHHAPLGVIRQIAQKHDETGNLDDRAYAFVQCYESNSGWVVVRGTAHWLRLQNRVRGVLQGEPDEIADVEIEISGVGAGVEIRGSVGVHQNNLGMDEWDLDGGGRHSVEPSVFERLVSLPLAAQTLAEAFVKCLLPDARRNDEVDLFNIPGVKFRQRNVILLGAITEGVQARATAIQADYDQVRNRCVEREFEVYQERISAFLEQCRALDTDVQQSGGKITAVLLDTPGGPIRREVELLERAEAHWHDLGRIATRSATDINEKLLAVQDDLSLNLMKSVLKNYLDWSGAIPGSPESVLSLLGGAAENIPWDLPSSVSGWIESAEQDASILEQQATTVARLTELRDFCLLRAEQAVDELRRLKSAREKRQPYATADEETAAALEQLGSVRFERVP